MKQYRWLLFDADGTLFDYDRAEAQAFLETLTSSHISFDKRYLEEYRRINGVLWQAFEQGSVSQSNLKVERFRQFCQIAEISADPAELSRLYLANLSKGAYLIDGALETVQALAGSYQLAIITNGLKNVQRSRFKLAPITPYFSTIIISEEVGVAKPDPRIFDIAFMQMDNPPKEEVLIIGDSLTSDISGGVAYGIDTCWFNPQGRDRPDGLAIRYEIDDLKQLMSLLD